VVELLKYHYEPVAVLLAPSHIIWYPGHGLTARRSGDPKM
jgi:hypothetical protein